MQKNEMWWNYKIDSQSYKSFIFRVSDNGDEFKILFDLSVDGSGLDIRFVLCTYEGYKKLKKWMNNKNIYQRDSDGQPVYDKMGFPIMVPVPKPQIREFFNVKTNILNKTVNLSSGKYTLLFDNTYSAMTGKNLNLHIVETWNEKSIGENLPMVLPSVNEMPSDVVKCINDANDCYVAGHYNQCSVMLRKAIELAIRIKLYQAGLSINQLRDESGNEIGLSSKIKLLRKEKLVPQKNILDIEQVKWFGDVGAHRTMQVAERDIKDNIEPKLRNFLAELNLRP